MLVAGEPHQGLPLFHGTKAFKKQGLGSPTPAPVPPPSGAPNPVPTVHIPR